jgi:geranylgeranyl diphosphate synthase, type II
MTLNSNRITLDINKYFKEKLVVINKKLSFYIQKNTSSGKLSDAMRYAVMAGGKRLRPILCIAAGETVLGVSNENLVDAGCALEFIHTYSLIHDDLPAMDDDSIRRGNPTCHVAFDEATAILAGDALLTLAFEVLSVDIPRCDIAVADCLRIIGIISKAAGARGMVEGQMWDISAEGQLLSLEALESLHGLKTGALISASVETGALLAGADERQQAHLREYARLLGIAFQVTDDLLNVEGDPAVMGKAVGTDAAKMKNTYPALMGLAASKEKARRLIDDALQTLDIFDTRADPLRAIATYVIERDK